MNVRVLCIAGIAALLMACPHPKKPEGGIELVFGKPSKAKKASSVKPVSTDAGADAGTSANRDAGADAGISDAGTSADEFEDVVDEDEERDVDVRPAIERRLALLKFKARLTEDEDTITVRLPGATPETASELKSLMFLRGKLELCTLDATAMKTWCELDARGIEAVSLEGEGCSLKSKDVETLKVMSGVQQAKRALFQELEDHQHQAYAIETCFSPKVLSATVKLNADTRRPEILVSLDSAGKKSLTEVTQSHLNKRLLIVIDDRVEIAPRVMSPIEGGRVTITLGSEMNEAQAQTLANAMMAGPLPKLSFEKETVYGAMR